MFSFGVHSNCMKRVIPNRIAATIVFLLIKMRSEHAILSINTQIIGADCTYYSHCS